MNHYLHFFKIYFRDPWVKKGVYIALALLFLIFSFGLEPKQKSSTRKATSAVADSFPLSQMIPKGFSLISLKLENEEALNELIAVSATVDLHFTPLVPLPGQKVTLPLRQVQIVKNSSDRDRFSALVPHDQVQKLLKRDFLVFAAITPEKDSAAKTQDRKDWHSKRLNTVEGYL